MANSADHDQTDYDIHKSQRQDRLKVHRKYMLYPAIKGLDLSCEV